MKNKRFLSILLTFAMLLSLLPAVTIPAQSADSAEAIVIIYDLEGDICDSRIYQVGDEFTVTYVLNTSNINDGIS